MRLRKSISGLELYRFLKKILSFVFGIEILAIVGWLATHDNDIFVVAIAFLVVVAVLALIVKKKFGIIEFRDLNGKKL